MGGSCRENKLNIQKRCQARKIKYNKKEEATDYPSRPSAATKKLEPQISQITQIFFSCFSCFSWIIFTAACHDAAPSP
jgi:hypothetical protein